MTDLSPAAQAVRDAAEKQTDLDLRYAPQIAAAALRAAADQVVPVENTKSKMFAWQHERLAQRLMTRDKLLAIAAELEAQ
jgi:hypothetical protein